MWMNTHGNMEIVNMFESESFPNIWCCCFFIAIHIYITLYANTSHHIHFAKKARKYKTITVYIKTYYIFSVFVWLYGLYAIAMCSCTKCLFFYGFRAFERISDRHIVHTPTFMLAMPCHSNNGVRRMNSDWQRSEQNVESKWKHLIFKIDETFTRKSAHQTNVRTFRCREFQMKTIYLEILILSLSLCSLKMCVRCLLIANRKW